ncbi:MAG: DUF2442 domain-containing protein [Polyangiaceae bacterium]
MSTSASDRPHARAVKIARGQLVVSLQDGRTLSVPLAWFPRLRDASSADLRAYTFIGKGAGIRWAKLDEDLSIDGLLNPPARRRARSRRTPSPSR